LCSACSGGPQRASASFVYDALGNLIRKDIDGGIVDMDYDAANRLSRMRDSRDGGAWRNYAYDNRGNVSDNARLTFVYDAAEQPVAMGGAASGTFSYDGNLKRVKQTIDGETIYSVYSQSGAILYRDNATTGEATDYIRAAGMTIARVRGNATTFLHSDHLGSPVAATDIAGNILWRERYSPYGEKQLDPALNRDGEGFTGHIDDAASGLTYMQARYYDPVIGRFLSNDPVAFAVDRPQYFNRYAYVHNDPINMTDPDGQRAIAWSVRLVKGGVKRVKAFADKKHAIQARQRGENVQASSRQMAGQIERGAARNPNDVMRHSGHELKDGSGKTGLPHFQTDGQTGHTFWSVASAVLGTSIAVLEVAEQLDPINLISGGCAPGSPGCVGPQQSSSENNQSQGANSSSDNNNSESQDSQQSDSSSYWSIDGDTITGTRCTGRLDCGG